MNIGQAAAESGVTAKMIRYYEGIDLIKQSKRTDAGYRNYGVSELHTLRFIKRARTLGFSINEIRDLLSLWGDEGRASADVKAIAQMHVADLNQRIEELTEMRDSLSHLAQACNGDHRPDCPILKSLGMLEEATGGDSHVR